MRAVLYIIAGYIALLLFMIAVSTFPWGIPFYPTVPIIGAIVCWIALSLIDMAKSRRY